MEGDATRTILFFLLLATAIQGAFPLEFEEVPHEAEVEAGRSVLIQCETKTAVGECQWIWKSLVDLSTPPIVVSTFPSYGNGSRDCGVRFKNVDVTQEGLWICGARENPPEPFTLASPFRLALLQTTTQPPTTVSPPPRVVQFAEIATDQQVKLGMPMHLICKTVKAVDECIWSWKADDSVNVTEIPIKTVVPFGVERLNCDIRFERAMKKQDGFWTCGARLHEDERFSTARPIKVTILEAVEFVQLSQDIQVAIGEPVLLRCITNIRVEECQWSWQALGRANDTPSVVKEFPPYGIDGRDCSVRFKNVLEEQEGIWRCQVRLASETEFTIAPPANFTLLYPAKVKFVAQPLATSIARGEPVVLNCVTSLSMKECSWTWQQKTKTSTKPLLVKSFPPFGQHSRDCSVRFKNVLMEQEGLWGCTVKGQNTTLTAEPILLSVFEPVPINFVQLSKDIQMPAGSPLLLRCVTDVVVEECRWMWHAFNDTSSSATVFKQFPSSGEGRDCSVRFSSVSHEQEGMWTCAARNHGEARYTSAPPAKVSLLQSESVTVALWASHDNNVSLACRLSSPTVSATCRWHHPPHQPMGESNHSSRFWIHHVQSSGVCTLSFAPQTQDLGQWTCSFNVDTPEGNWQLATANLILLNTPTTGLAVSEEQMGWLVGVLALLVVVLTATLVAISVCKWRSPSSDRRDSLGGTAQCSQGEKKDLSRYTDSPTKIDFQFRETMTRSSPEPAVATLPEPNHHHIYERVDRLIMPPINKGLYENVD